MSTIKATNFQHASAAAPAIVLAADGSATANVSSINNGPLAGMRNAIINGNFDIWQRGTSFTNPANTAYTADRWSAIWNGSGATRTVERVNFPLGQTDVPGEPAYMLRFAQTVGGTGATFNQLAQLIEDVRTFAGQQVTISFYMRSTASITLPTVQFVQNFGTGGLPSAVVITNLLTSVSITTSWQRIQATVTVPSISGKALGSNGDSSLAFDIGFPLNSTFSVDIAQVQVEPGPVATPFERRPIGTELALCQRYYCETRAAARFYSAINSQANENQVYWPAEMRGTPTTTISTGGSRQNIASVSLQSPTKYGSRFVIVATSLTVDTFALNEIITASAEL